MAMIFTLTQSTNAPILEFTCFNQVGGAQSLAAATSVVFSMRNAQDDTVKISDAVAIFTDQNAGKVGYSFTLTDTDTVGQFLGKFTVTWNDGKKTAWPTSPTPADNYITINIVDDAKAAG